MTSNDWIPCLGSAWNLEPKLWKLAPPEAFLLAKLKVAGAGRNFVSLCYESTHGNNP